MKFLREWFEKFDKENYQQREARLDKLEAVADEARGVVAALEGAHFDCSELAAALDALEE